MIRIGLLGASRIARGAVIKPASSLETVEVVAVAARSSARARDYAAAHGIATVLGDYGELVTSDRVDLIYNALPPSEHLHWTQAAVRAGKHVLCEKPFAMNAEEASAMVEAARQADRYLIEAFHHRFHPLWNRVPEILTSGAIGEIKRITGRFNVPIASTPGELRYVPALGGGGLMDLGCYPIHWARTVVGEEPDVLSASARWHSTGVDIEVAAELAFPGGVTAAVHCAMDEAQTGPRVADMVVEGSAGTLIVDNPLAPHDGHRILIRNADGEREEAVPGDTTYLHQLRHVVEVVAGRATPVTGGADAIGNMRVIDQILRVARDA